MTTHTITITDAQRQTLKELAYWAQTSDSITEAESDVLDHILATPAPIATPKGHSIKEYKLTQRNDVPACFRGVALTKEYLGAFIASDVHVFRTIGGEYLLYVGTVGYQRTRAHINQLYRNADTLTATDVVRACNGLPSYAEPALKALGLKTAEHIS